MELSVKGLNVYIKEFTPSSYIMFTLNKHHSCKKLLNLIKYYLDNASCEKNLKLASRHFIKLERSNGMTSSLDQIVGLDDYYE